METAGRFAGKPGCHSIFVGCMPSTRQGVCHVQWSSQILCFRFISYLEGKQSCASCPTFAFYVCLLFSSQTCLKPFASSASLLLEGGSPLPKFVFTSSLAVFGETYAEAGIPVGSGGMFSCT